MLPADLQLAQPACRPFQFGLRSLLLLFVLLGSSLGVFGAWGILVFLLNVALAIFLYVTRVRLSCLFVVVLVIGLLCVAGSLLLGPMPMCRCPRSDLCRRRLDSIWCALEFYGVEHNNLPPAYTIGKDGKPMHSWRALILPDLATKPPFKSYDFGQPWDSPNNKALLTTAPEIFQCSRSGPPAGNETSYVAVVGPDAAFAGDKPRKLEEIDFPDRGTTTIMVVEVADSHIPWSEPRDLVLDELRTPGKNGPALACGFHEWHDKEFLFKIRSYQAVHVLAADGTVGMLRTAGLSDDQLRDKLRIGGCRTSDLEGFDYYEPRNTWANIAALIVWLLSVWASLATAVRSRNYR
jgi:hypothetical protein